MTTQNKAKKAKKPELLAPAGNLEKMKTAFAFGADAVYAGIPDFSLRVRINDFTLATLAEAIEYAHARKKKVYVTINIFAHNEHLKKLPGYIKELKKIKPDALIISDPGVISVVLKHWPEAEIHLSTQANCTNGAAAMFWHKAGAKRVILGREVAYADILEMKKEAPKLELETFIHGAMCMAYSGRCFLSKYIKDRSANLGDCVQPCRWEYKVNEQRIMNSEQSENNHRHSGPDPESMRLTSGLIENGSRIKSGMTENEMMEKTTIISPKGHEAQFELVEEQHGSYILNSNDMCLMRHMPELIDSKLESLKIEGRAKSNYYLAMVIGAYRKAIDLSYDALVIPGRSASAGEGNPVKVNLNANKKNAAKLDISGSPSLVALAGDDKLRREINKLYKELESKLVHRGYTEGFMFGEGEQAQNLVNSHNTCEWEFCGQVVKDERLKIKDKRLETKTLVRVHNALKVGDTIEVVVPGYDIIKKKVDKIWDIETGELMQAAHGGQGKTVLLDFKREVPEFSVLRRKV